MTYEPNGLLLVDKAEGWTSHDAVAKSRRALGTRKVGHAGTLDPMATGLLLLGAGPSTRLLTHLVGLDKTYQATIRLGQSTLTDDREGEVRMTADAADLAALRADRAPLDAVVATLTGQILQAPSAVSAIKVDGRRAYDRVRAGEDVQLKQRAVTVHRFEVGELREVQAADGTPVIDVDATVVCSSGTYVRALARDLGAALSVGGHLVALRRTHVGPFDVADAVSTASVKAAEVTAAHLMTPTDVASRLFPVIMLDQSQERDLGHGKRLDLTPEQGLNDGSSSATLAAAVAPSGRLVGLVEVKGGRTRVVTNFPVVARQTRAKEDDA